MKVITQTKIACALVLLASATFCRADLVLDTGALAEPPAALDTQEWLAEPGQDGSPMVMAAPVVPEPSTLIGGALLLVPFAVAAVRRFRR